MQRKDNGKKKKSDNSRKKFSASITTVSFMLLLCGSGKAHFRKLKRKDYYQCPESQAHHCFVGLTTFSCSYETMIDHLGKHLQYSHMPLRDKCIVHEWKWIR